MLDRIRAVFSVAVGVGLWVFTWVFPLTFMVAMAWGCETHTRQLGRRALMFYGGEQATVVAAIAAADRRRDRGHDKRAILRALAFFVSIAIPIGFVVYANHIRQVRGITWLTALGTLVAVSLVIATAVISSRR